MTDCDQHHCVTCGDDAEPMTVQRIDVERGLALCADEQGVRRTVDIALVDPLVVGDQVLVHAGVALVAAPT